MRPGRKRHLELTTDGSDLERLRRDTNQRTSMVKTLDGVTGLESFVPGHDDFNEDECKKIIRSVEARPGDEATVAELDLRLEERGSAELKRVSADFNHALILFCKGKAVNIVLTNKVGEGFESWRALVNKYEPTSKASVVGKLAEILRTPFDGDLLDAITTFERKIMIYEAQSRETISDSLKIGCVIAGMGQNSMKEHLLMSATKCGSWTNFVREIESIEHTRKTTMDLDAFRGNCHKCGSTNTLRKNVGIRAMEGQRNLNVHKVERNIMDSAGYEATHLPTKIHRKEDGKETEKETAREPRKVESSKVEKAETMGKEKVEERKHNVSTKSQNHQKNSGEVEPGNNGQNNVGTQKPTLRVRVTMIGTLQIRILRPQRQLKNFSMRLLVICDSRIWVMSNTSNLFNVNDWILHSELSHLVLIPQRVKLLFLPITLQHAGIWSTKTQYLDARTALQAETKCMIKERGSCAPWMRQESRWPSGAEQVDCRRPLMAVTEMTDCGRWACFGPQRQGFSFDPRTGQKIELRRHLVDGI